MTPNRQTEDPHDSPLHHSYTLGRDLPEVLPTLRAYGTTAPVEFFQAGRTYRAGLHADLVFECLAISVVPDTGQRVAVGWRFGPSRDGVRPCKLAALDSGDFACCGWSEAPVCECGHSAAVHRPGGCIGAAVHSGLVGLCGCTAEVTAL
jgi:hypothetical protein